LDVHPDSGGCWTTWSHRNGIVFTEEQVDLAKVMDYRRLGLHLSLTS